MSYLSMRLREDRRWSGRKLIEVSLFGKTKLVPDYRDNQLREGWEFEQPTTLGEGYPWSRGA